MGAASGRWLAIAAAGALVFAVADPAFAQSSTLRREPAPTYIDGVQTQILVGVEGTRKRHDLTDALNEASGFIVGVTVEGRVSLGDWQARVEGRYGQGEVKRSGAQSGTDTDWELRALVGKHVWKAPGRRTYVFPYAGIGRYSFTDKGHVSPPLPGGGPITRQFIYDYVPLGVEAMLDFGNLWSVKPTLEYDYVLADAAFWTTSSAPPEQLKVKSGEGVRGSVMLNRVFGTREFEAGPFFRYFRVLHENPYSTLSPNFRTLDVGISSKFGF